MSIIRNFLFLAFVVFPILGMAQNNSFKFTMAPTIVHTHNFALAYERKLSDQFAAGLKVNYGARNVLPCNRIASNEIGQMLNMTGWKTENDCQSHGASFHFRFLLHKKTSSRFYVDTNLGYQTGKFYGTDFVFRPYEYIPIQYVAGLKGGFQFFGGGIGIGNQWTNKKGISIDVLWVGLGLGKNTMNIQATSTAKGYFNDVYGAFNKYMSKREDLIDFLRMDISATYDTKGIYVVAHNTMPIVKILNVSLGFSF
jgi:hypothetical protein